MPDDPTAPIDGDPATGDPAATTTAAVPPSAHDTDPAPAALGDAGKKALEAERAARKALERRLGELEPLAEEARKAAEARKTAEQKLAEKLTAESARAASAELNMLQLRAAMAAAPAGMELADIEELAGRLRGSTADELAADAAKLFGRLAPPPPAQALPSGQRPVEQLRSGALPSTPEPSIDAQIQAAQAAGNWAEVVRLGSVRVQQIRAGN